MTDTVEDVLDYLRSGGMGEVIGLTDMARQMKEPKVQMGTDMAMALCLLASEALDEREKFLRAGFPPAPLTRQ